MGQHLEVLIMPPHQPLVHQLLLDPRAQSRAAHEPLAVGHSVEAGGVPADVLPVDRRLRGEDVLEYGDQPLHVGATLLLG